MPESTLWKSALDNLSEDERRYLNVTLADLSDVAGQALAAVTEKQKSRLDKRWRISKGNGKEVIIRDLLERSAKWIQKFKEVGDIAVQYDTTAASLPWAAVRLVLQVSVHDVEAFRAVAEGIEAVTRVLSRCAVYEAMYLGPTSEELKASRHLLRTELEVLYSALLRYLAKVAAYYDQSTAKRLLGSALNSTGGTGEAFDNLLAHEKEVERVAQILHGEVAIRTAPTIKSVEHAQLAHQNALERLFDLLERPIMQSAENLLRMKTMTERQEQQALGLWLSPINHREEHRRVSSGVLLGTGEWLFRRDEYRQWDGSNSSAILWMHGIAGCGKTNLMSIVMQKFLAARETNPSEAPVAYFYCSKNTSKPVERSATAVARSLLKQLAFRQQGNRIHGLVYDEFRKRKRVAEEEGVELLVPTLDDSIGLLLGILRDGPATVVIDGMDELEDDLDSLLIALKRLIKESPHLLKIMLSSRDETRVASHLSQFPQVAVTALDNSKDIALFIEATLDTAIQERRILQGNVSPDLRELIIATLQRGASSMFLWAALHIQQLCDQERFKLRSDVVNALTVLPSTLDSVFRQIYGRIENYPSVAQRAARRIIAWILVAERPLTVTEIQSATSYEVSTATGDREDILTLCSGLISIDPISNQVALAHASIREFLQELPDYSIPRLNAFAASECIRYLLNGSDSADLSDPDDASDGAQSFHSYSILYWARHCSRVEPPLMKTDLDSVLSAFITEDEGLNFQFWFDDVQHLLDEQLIVEPSLMAELNAIMSANKSAAFVAAVYGCSAILDKVIELDPEFNYNMNNSLGASLIYIGSRYGHGEVVDRLIQLGADLNIRGGYFGTPVQAAAYRGHDTVVRSLLVAGANICLKSKFDTAVHAAIAGGKDSTACLILLERPDFELDFEELLVTASYRGLHSVVDLLLHKRDEKSIGIGPDPSPYQLDALQGALYRRRTKVAMRLLKGLPDVNIQGGHFQNAMQAACMGGHYILVSKLLDMGADPNTIGRYGSPLKAVCYTGEDNIAELLIEKGAIVSSNEGNALEAAASRGHYSTLKLLMNHFFSSKVQDHGDKPSKQQRSLVKYALFAASRGNHSDAVTYLLEHGAREFASQALEYALEMHSHEAARLLLCGTQEIKDYSRYGAIPCSADSRDAWLAGNFEEELDSVRSRERRPSQDEETSSATKAFLERELADLEASISTNHGHYPHSLGGGYPGGKEYLARLMAVRGSASEVDALVSRGIDVNGHNYPSPIEIAAKAGNLPVVALLLDRDAELRGALQTAIYCRKPDIVRLILQKRPNTETDVDTTSSVEKYYRGIQHRSALALAVEHGDENMVALLLQHKSTSNHTGPGPALYEAVKQKDKRKLNMILKATCTPHGAPWSEEEQRKIADAVKLAIRSNDLPTLEMILDTTKALEGDRVWIVEAIAYTAALLGNTDVLEYVHTLSGLAEKVAIAGSVLKARASDSKWMRHEENSLAGQASDEIDVDSASSWDEIDISSERPHAREFETLTATWNEQLVFEKFILPYTGFDSFKDSLKSTFHMLVDTDKYNAGAEILRRFRDVEHISSDPLILQSVLQPESDLYRYSQDERKDDLLALVRLLVERGAYINSLDEHGKAPLYYACAKGLEKPLLLLLEAGADHTVMHSHESKDNDRSVEGDRASSPTKERLNLLQLTLQNIRIQVNGHEMASEHTRWASIVFQLAKTGLRCEMSQPGAITLFESACNLNLVEDLEKLMDPEIWNDVKSMQPDRYFLANSSGLHIAVGRAHKEAVTILLEHHPDLGQKRYFQTHSEKLTPLRAALDHIWYQFGKEKLWDILEQLVDYGVPEDDAQELLATYLKQDALERARRLLQKGVKVTTIPEYISADALSLLLDKDYRLLVNTKSLKNTIIPSIESDKATYDSISQRLDILAEFGIPLPSASSLFHALIDRNYSLKQNEKIALLDRFMHEVGHGINDLFPCKDCGNPLNLLSLVYESNYRNETELFEAILERGADTDCPGLPYSALVMVCRSNRGTYSTETQAPAARLVLQHGANVHGVRKTALQAPDVEQTPLMYAVGSKNIELVSLLLEHGADINRGYIAPLSIALRARIAVLKEDKLVNMLLEKGAKTWQHDVDLEGKLDPALGVGSGHYWSFRYCFDCKMYVKYDDIDFGMDLE